jgi:hypothetical protein
LTREFHWLAGFFVSVFNRQRAAIAEFKGLGLQ